MVDINEILDSMENLPPLSHTVMLLVNEISQVNHSVNDIKELVENDPLLAGKLLKLVNSAAYARRVPAETIDDAVRYVGDMPILALAMQGGGKSIYSGELLGYEAARGALWEHSLRVAIAAKHLAVYSKQEISKGVAYSAGILHDIGKVILSAYLKPEDIHVFLEKDNFLQAEKEAVGIDHCEVGLKLAERWKFPESIKQVIAYHHDPDSASDEYRSLAYIVHLADMVAMIDGMGTGVDTLRYDLSQNYPEYVDITNKYVEKVLLDTGKEFSKLQEAMDASR